MSLAVVSEEDAASTLPEQVGVPLMLDALGEAGTYVCNWSGHLLRVRDPDETRVAAVGRAAGALWTVTRVSSDPYISRFEARALARRFGLNPSF